MHNPNYSTKLNYPAFIKRQLDYFENKKWQTHEFNNLRADYANKIGFFHSTHIGLDVGAKLYRARSTRKEGFNLMRMLFEITKNDLFDNIKLLGINTKENTRTFGRANSPGNPVFYSCISPTTSIYEVMQWDRIQNNLDIRSSVVISEEERNRIHKIHQESFFKLLVLSEWEVQQPLNLACVFDKALISGEMAEIIEKNEASNPYRDEIKNSQEGESLQLIENFFAKEFTKKNIAGESDYMLSALCAESMLLASKIPEGGRYKPTDGIIYASVVERYEGVNCVLAEETIARGKVKFVSAKAYLVSNQEEGMRVLVANANVISEETGELDWEVINGSHPPVH
jgi:hypothetical protein